jgi:RimJ/RimL family protein N-acetyltransferase
MAAQSSGELPIGARVENTKPAPIPTKKTYAGEFVKLHPVDPENDVDELFLNSHGSEVKERIWTYMAYGPFSKKYDMLDWLKGCEASTNMSFYTVISNELNQRVGMMSILNIVEPMRTLELGNIWYSPIVHFTKVNTEVVYLLLSEIFDRLKYRRVEWKCDTLNARSRAAALRLGFSFEGIFRQHFIVKNRNRDTAWFAMTDKDWSEIRINMEKWLYAAESDSSLSVLNKGMLSPTCREI